MVLLVYIFQSGYLVSDMGAIEHDGLEYMFVIVNNILIVDCKL